MRFKGIIAFEVRRSEHSPVSPVVDLQPGEDGAAGDEGARQHAEPGQVGGEQLPDRVLQHGDGVRDQHRVGARGICQVIQIRLMQPRILIRITGLFLFSAVFS